MQISPLWQELSKHLRGKTQIIILEKVKSASRHFFVNFVKILKEGNAAFVCNIGETN